MIEKFHSKENTFLNLHYTDPFGGWHTLTVPASGVKIENLDSAIPFDGSSVPGLRQVESGDIGIRPIPDTFFNEFLFEKDNHMNEQCAGVICEIIEIESGKPVNNDPRTILQKAEELIRDELKAQSMWLPELEFYLFSSVDFSLSPELAFFKISSQESLPINKTSWAYDADCKGGYHSSPPQDKGYSFRANLVEMAEKTGIKIRYHHHEVGKAGQCEIELMPAPPLKSADSIMLIKYFARNLASRLNYFVTFMPKPLAGYPGNGLHFHQWLLKNGQSLFWDKSGKYANLSETALSYIAGLLIHAPALCAFTNPSTNSYKRLVPGFEAPTKLFFGLANRSAAIRIPKYVDDPHQKRIEYRPPDASANPYLAIAGMMLAGLDGIKKKLDPTKLGFGPFNDNVTLWEPTKQAELKPLPTNLLESVQALEIDNKFLTQDGIFPQDLVEQYCKILTKAYWDSNSVPTIWEIVNYFNV